LRQYHDNLRAIVLAKPFAHGITDRVRCELLILDVDCFLDRGDCVNQQPFNLPYYRLTIVFLEGARNADRGINEVGDDQELHERNAERRSRDYDWPLRH
jgi:hypothetical protein